MRHITVSRRIVVAALGLLLLPLSIALSAPGSSAPLPLFIDLIKDGTIDGLNLAAGAAVSPDGKHVYVASEGDDAVAVFDRNSIAGSLSFIERVKDGVNGVDGLNTVLAVAISPDGSNLYAASRDDDAVAVFSRSVITGGLTFIEMQKDGIGGVDGLDGAYAVVISPDGKHVYTSSENDDAVAVFSRSTITGGLTFVEIQKDGAGGVDGLNTSRGLTISPDGKHVYATGVDDDTVAVFSRSTITGGLTFVETQKDGLAGVDGLNGARAVAVSPDNLHVYATGVVDSGVAVFSRSVITGGLTYAGVYKDGVAGVDGMAFAVSVMVSPDGKQVYVAGYNDDAIAIFNRNATTGALTYSGLAQNNVNGVQSLDGPNWLAASPNGDHIYVPGRVVNAIVTLGRNSATGALAFVEADLDGAGVDGLNGAMAAAFSSDGQHLYVAGFADNGVGVLQRNATTGKLAFVQAQLDIFPNDGLGGATAVLVSPDGQHVYAAAQQDNSLAIFNRSAITGGLTYVAAVFDDTGGVDGLSNPEVAVISPDGQNIYVAATGENAVGVFSRDPLSGTLTFVEKKQNGVGGVDGLNSTQGIAISPDGKHVYATGTTDDAVAVFSRSSITGGLTFVEVRQDGVGDINGLDFARGVALSPDGKHVYVTGEADDAVAVFGRNSTSGSLTFLEVQQNGVGGVDGLGGAYGLTVSPDGRYVYVVSESGDSLAVFDRDVASGLLTFKSVQRDGLSSVDGLDAARAVVVSPDNRHIYVASFLDDAIAIFAGERRVYLPLVLRSN